MAIDNKPLYMEHLGYTAARDQQMLAMLVGFRYGDDTGTVGISGANDYSLTQIDSTPQYGVFPPLDSLKVYLPSGLTGLTFRVNPGVGILPFTANLGTFGSETDGGGNTTEPRAILAAVNGSYFSGTLNQVAGGSGVRVDLVYAKADTRNIATSVFSRSGTTCTITTSTTAHAFRVGDTVNVVSTVGTSRPADGTYTITAVTTYTFTITTSDSATVTGGAITGKVCVPFSIGVVEGAGGTTVPSIPATVIGIPLAAITVTNTAISAVVDYRQFVSSPGGVHYYENSSNPQFKYNGKLEYNVSQGLLYLYDKSTQATTKSTTGLKLLYKADTGHHDTVPTDYNAAALHHTLGTGIQQAASGQHTHEGLTLVRPTRLWATGSGTDNSPALSVGTSGSDEKAGLYIDASGNPKWAIDNAAAGNFFVYTGSSPTISAGVKSLSPSWNRVNTSGQYYYYAAFNITDATGVSSTDAIALSVEYVDNGNIPLMAYITSVSSNTIAGRVVSLPQWNIAAQGTISFETTVPTTTFKLHWTATPQGSFYQKKTT
jgi:hypothetical protein